MTQEGVMALIISVLTFVGLIYTSVYRTSKVEAKVELMWGFLLRQGLTSSILGGVMERNSPLKVNTERLAGYHTFINNVKAWYDADQKLHRITDLELYMKLEDKFHLELTEICIGEKILPGGCTAALLFMIRPEAEIFKKFDTSDWHR